MKNHFRSGTELTLSVAAVADGLSFLSSGVFSFLQGSWADEQPRAHGLRELRDVWCKTGWQCQYGNGRGRRKREEERGGRGVGRRSEGRMRGRGERKSREEDQQIRGRTVGPSLSLFSGCGLLVPRLHPRHWQRRTPAVI